MWGTYYLENTREVKSGTPLAAIFKVGTNDKGHQRILCDQSCQSRKMHHGFDLLPPETSVLMDHAKKYHKAQLANQGAFKRATQEVDDAKIQRFLLEGQESPTLVNATNEVMNIHFVSKRRNATKEKDASSVKGGFKAETSGFGVNGGKATTYPEECDRICTSQKKHKGLQRNAKKFQGMPSNVN